MRPTVGNKPPPSEYSGNNATYGGQHTQESAYAGNNATYGGQHTPSAYTGKNSYTGGYAPAGGAAPYSIATVTPVVGTLTPIQIKAPTNSHPGMQVKLQNPLLPRGVEPLRKLEII